MKIIAKSDFFHSKIPEFSDFCDFFAFRPPKRPVPKRRRTFCRAVPAAASVEPPLVQQSLLNTRDFELQTIFVGFWCLMTWNSSGGASLQSLKRKILKIRRNLANFELKTWFFRFFLNIFTIKTSPPGSSFFFFGFTPKVRRNLVLLKDSVRKIGLLSIFCGKKVKRAEFEWIFNFRAGRNRKFGKELI